MCKIIELNIPFSAGAGNGYIHPVLLRDDNNLILVDCGYGGSLNAIEQAIERAGLSAADVTGIVLTHQDHDHIGAANAFKKKYPDVKIYAHTLEEPFIAGREKSLRLVQAEKLQPSLPPDKQEWGNQFCEMLRCVEPTAVDVLLDGGEIFDWCGGCQVVHTPGHTPGHISLYLSTQKAIIAGDAMSAENGRITIPNPQFTLDMDTAKASMEALLGLAAETVYCYHGGKVNVNGTSDGKETQ